MAPPTRPWFRFYVEALHDRKLRTIAPAWRWLWVALLGMARSSPEPGRLLVADGVPADAVVIADEAALPLKETIAGLAYFERLGMVHQDDDGTWVVRAFLGRQYESDSSTDRTSKHRSNVAASSDDASSQERSSSVSVSGSVLSQENQWFDEFWEIYPRKEGKIAARKAFSKALKAADVAVVITGAARFRDDPNRDPAFTAHPTTWLNQGRWDDEPLPHRNGKAKSSALDRAFS